MPRQALRQPEPRHLGASSPSLIGRDGPLVANLGRGAVLVSGPYADLELAEHASQPLAGGAAPETARPGVDRTQELLREAAAGRALEVHTQENVEADFRNLRWGALWVGVRHLGYELDCAKAEDRQLHLEVKGRRGLSDEVFLTRKKIIPLQPVIRMRRAARPVRPLSGRSLASRQASRGYRIRSAQSSIGL